jgi:hypothetical protein
MSKHSFASPTAQSPQTEGSPSIEVQQLVRESPARPPRSR